MTVVDIDGSDDVVNTPDERLADALMQFTACVCAPLEDICSYGLTIGETYVPFDPDPEDECEDEEVACSQAWVRVAGTNLKEMPDSFDGPSCATVLSLTLEVGVLRCIEIPERGEAPTATDVLIASLQAMKDMRAILCAALGCEVWDMIEVGNWSPDGPLGGQYGGIWTFTVEL